MGNQQGADAPRSTNQGAPPEEGQGSFTENLWMVSCRPFDDTCSVFSENTILFQPDTRLLSNSYEYGYDRENQSHVVQDTITANLLDLDNQSGSVSARAREPFPSNSTVLVYVHGFRQTYEKVFRVVDHLRNRTHDMLTVVGMLWPCHVKHAAYLKARDKAKLASKKLRLALQYMLARGNKVHVFAHSLGTRVALGALLDSGLFQYGEGEMGDLFLAAGAVASDSLGERGEFPAHRVAAETIVVYHSTKDDVLRQALPMVEAIPALVSGRARAETKALGYKGPTGDVHAKVRPIDCTATVYMHRIHVYLASPQVNGPLLEACGMADLVCFVDGQSTSVLNEGPFSPSTHHDEFVRQTSKYLYDNDSPSLGPCVLEPEPMSPQHSEQEADSDDETSMVL
eukprot:TRINITY_DN36148_c0_g1_i1.p1 TRINITY_DN36148_c0_g1~~TRINITY_DN36148_c0_g1_i1.p1  ORF type:complete len:398 (+),score=92.42 TRINITY_DN36148_c0_g1_i1:17-1210(+)